MIVKKAAGVLASLSKTVVNRSPAIYLRLYKDNSTSTLKICITSLESLAR